MKILLAFLSMLLVAALAALASAASGGAAIAPPWCGTPAPDAAGNLPDGTGATDPVGSFPHIPYYAIGCTLDEIAAQSNGRMTVEVTGQSALGRDLYLVTINDRETLGQRKAFANWEKLHRDALADPEKALKFLGKFGDDVKVPLYVQAGIHGNEYEGVDAIMRIIERLATTPYGADPQVDAVLDHAVLLVNVDQNPDGRALGQRANGFNFDLNRDFLTQSQSETKISVRIMQSWLPPDMLDMHGYATPTLVEATTKPHNPGIDYDLWLKWNQGRTLANKNALAAAGWNMQRPINDWCSDAGLPPCPAGESPGPAVAEGWDDWGPFYTPMYLQLVGLNGSTVEMCSSTGTGNCGSNPDSRGRLGARMVQELVAWSTFAYDIANRHDLLGDQLELYRRGVTDAPRPLCCPMPFGPENNWMLDYPRAYVIPLGPGQRSNPEANRLIEWLLRNGIVVEKLKKDTAFGSQTFAAGSYVVFMNQAHRGLADTALRIGVDVTPRINTLYAPPAAWSHGYLWGADVVTIPRGDEFDPLTKPVSVPEPIPGGLDTAGADLYALPIDSPTAVRALNALTGAGLTGSLALSSFTDAAGATLPAGTVIFGGGDASALAAAGQANGLVFRAVDSGALPATDPVAGTPRIAVLTNSVNQDVWSLRDLDFPADPVPTGGSSDLNNPAAANPLDGYDLVFNTSGWPSGSTARSRLTAFFNGGGGYIGAGGNGANFLGASASGQLPGLATTSQTGGGQSGIFYWDNVGGVDSLVVGAYPAQDTAIMDPPTWFSSVPVAASVDARLLGDTGSTFAAGLWREPRNAGAAGAPIVVHAQSSAPGSSARITSFAPNPLYRADPEREWPMVGTAAYWADQ